MSRKQSHWQTVFKRTGHVGFAIETGRKQRPEHDATSSFSCFINLDSAMRPQDTRFAAIVVWSHLSYRHSHTICMHHATMSMQLWRKPADRCSMQPKPLPPA